MGPFGVQEMMVIVVLALLLFGPKKLPELARILGKGLTEFRRAKNELKSTLDTHMRELEREVQIEEAKKNPVLPSATTYNPYAYLADESGRISDYNYNTASEPPVQSHALPAAPPVNGVVPRSAPASASENVSESNSDKVHDESHA